MMGRNPVNDIETRSPTESSRNEHPSFDSYDVEWNAWLADWSSHVHGFPRARQGIPFRHLHQFHFKAVISIRQNTPSQLPRRHLY